MFSEHLFHRKGIGLLLIFPGNSFLRRMEPWTPAYLLWINNLTWLEQLKQKAL